MKLELKHLSPYLPYNLEIAYIGSDGWWQEFHNCDTIKDDYSHIGTLSQLSSELAWLHFKHEGDCFEYQYNDLKPLLIPLSELTTDQWKEVFEAGLEESDKFFFTDYYDCDIIIGDTEASYDIRELVKYAFDTCQFTSSAKKYFQLNAFNKLFEFHADIYGQIDKGLALNKNTLKELIP